MSTLLHAVVSAAPLAAEVLIASAWQGVLLTAGVWLCLRLLRGLTPGIRSAVWSAVLVLLLCLPLLQLAPVPGSARAHGGVALHAARFWAWPLLGLWLVISSWRCVVLVRKALHLRGVLRRALPVSLTPTVEALLPRGRRISLYTSAEVNRPSVLGLGRPRILMPPALLEALSAAELEQVLLHEAEHLRRHDDWLDLLQGISLVLLPLHPALFWLDRQLCQERELACDDGVLRATHAPKAYAACLVKLAEASLAHRGISVALSALGARARQSELLGRVRRILGGTPGSLPTRRARLGATGAIGVAVLLAGVLAGSPEMVSFDGHTHTTPAVVAATATPLEVRFAPRPLMMLTGTAAVRPVLTSAVMTRPAVLSRAGQVASPGHRRLLRRTLQVKPADSVARRARPWVARPAVRQTIVGPRVVLTQFELPPTLYAAVPWRDGWLIVQL